MEECEHNPQTVQAQYTQTKHTLLYVRSLVMVKLTMDTTKV